MTRFFIAAALALLLHAGKAAAAPVFSLPIACTPGKDCWVVNYFDHDTSSAFQDHTCSWRGYDGHDGIDFSVGTLARMIQGMAVLAAADGVVQGSRDGELDTKRDDSNRSEIKGRECGNGVRLDHGDGWFSQYCHLRRGSVLVKKGDSVKRGQPLGLVGLSGMTQFPHVHFEVTSGSTAINPFTGTDATSDCKIAKKTLWDEKALAVLRYRPLQFYNHGVAPEPIDWDKAQLGAYAGKNSLPADAAALVTFFEIYGVEAGTQLTTKIIAPDGSVWLEDARTQAARKINLFSMAGRKRNDALWQTGAYTVTVTASAPQLPPISNQWQFHVIPATEKTP